MDYKFNYRNLTCCSLELHWTKTYEENDPLKDYDYELYIKEIAEDPIASIIPFLIIYQGSKNSFEAINLKPNQEYYFKLNIMKKGKLINEKTISVHTLSAPFAFLSENSTKIANGENIEYTNNLSDIQKGIINNCSKLIFENNEGTIIQGNFDGIEVKIAYEKESNIYYISFDIFPNEFKEFKDFFNQFIEQCQNNLIIPCHFIIQKLPTTLFFNLLEKGPVIFTGKRMGGVIASSLAFYILYIGKMLYNKKYGNSLKETEKNCIGVVSFGSPSFLTNLTAAVEMEKFTKYFINIKEELDYIPEIIDYIMKNYEYEKILNLINKTEWTRKDTAFVNEFMEINNFNKINLINKIIKFNKIPFGSYYMFTASDNKLISIYEYNFNEFYYLKIFNKNESNLNSKIYENLSSEIKFNKNPLIYLENKDNQLELIKIIRRISTVEKHDLIKGVIKIKLPKFENNIITPDIIDKIILKAGKTVYIIENKDIYYDNDVDITAYIDNLNENINEVIITNIFGGQMKVKHIMNIQGSGSTRKILRDNIEKIFLIPFFKLFEIFYISLKDNKKYEDLKEEFFGNNFENLKILKPFERQIQILDELLFLTRPDILGKFEKEFIQKYTKGKLTENQKKFFCDMLKIYYQQALKIQIERNINCLDSEKDSIAKICTFPIKIKGNNDIKKLFMCENKYFDFNNFILIKFNDLYIKSFYIEKLIKEALLNIENNIMKICKDKNDEQIKNNLNAYMGEFYNELIIPNIYFILIIILSSIESGDKIKFNMFNNFKDILFSSLTKKKITYIKDFKKQYTAEEIEYLHMKNLFNKIKTKNIIKSEISDENQIIKNNYWSFANSFDFRSFFGQFEQIINRKNKIFNFIECSENENIGEEYYYSFLKLLDNYSDDFSEDVEISIYDNLKEQNKSNISNFLAIKEMMDNIIKDEESRKGFLALLKQSYLLGKFRCDVVSIYSHYFYL